VRLRRRGPGEDLRIQCPPIVRIVCLMRSGALDPVFALKSLLEGADGVLIGGCNPGDCH
jgi:F420-non-reducing hydrogenase iron-sulfur subunit